MSDDLYKALGRLVFDNHIDMIAALYTDAQIGYNQGFTVRPSKLIELATRMQNLYDTINRKGLN